MTDKLLCPFCQQELNYLPEDIYGNMYCPNCRDKNGFIYKASESIWQELMLTRKALDAAKRRLMQIGYLNMSEHGLGSEKMMTDWCKTVALHGLKEIETALEQKDVK